ncbi:MAG TPA: FkbM family methyltransferase [Candidatus Dojkabacteria bacterium]|mgnify:FL=1|nr:FkbM family methyltransferase [Candidatus Dojkabacteria bacterium]
MNLIKESLNLDFKFLLISEISLLDRFNLIIKKYLYFILRLLGANKRNHGKFLGKEFTFPNKYGYVGLQRVIVDNIFLKKYLPERISVVDIGAHAGEFAFFLEKIINAKKVASVEPFQTTFEILKKNFPNNQNFQYAITNKEDVELYISEISTQLNSLFPDDSRKQNQKIKVPSITLSKFVSDEVKGEFHLLKIDTEGSEYNVLNSGLDVINKFKYLLVEIELEREGYLKILELLSGQKNYKLIAMGDYKQGQRAVDVLVKKN